MRITTVTCNLLALTLLLSGCAQETPLPATAVQNGTSAGDIDGSKYLLTAEPEGASDVITVRSEAEQGDEVLIVGRIGGSVNPWIDGRAAFTIVDESLKACSDIEGDQCPKPWDYCCETDKLPTATALVKFMDDNGDLLRTDAKQLLSVKELSTVVVKGTAARDDAGNLTVLANAVYVR